MSTGLKANSDGSAAIQVGGTDVITLTSGGAATFVTSPTTVQAGTAAAPSITFSGDTNTGIYSPGADQVAIATGGTKRFEVDAAGNAGLGVTPNTWAGTGVKAFQFQNGALAASSSFGTMLSWNAYYDGSYKYTASTTAGMYQVGGTHAWYTAPSGTAGNNITFTAVMSVEGGKSLALEGATSQSGTGITFPATQSASSNANTLDDYEEGSWTPTAIFSTSNGDRSYTYQVGRYIKIGNLVHVQGWVEFSETTASGNLSIGGLPFAASSATGNYSCGSFYVNNMTGLSGMVMALIGGDTPANQITMFYSGTGGRTNISSSNTGSISSVIFDVCYQVG